MISDAEHGFMCLFGNSCLSFEELSGHVLCPFKNRGFVVVVDKHFTPIPHNGTVREVILKLKF
jgi:hypothetical protein